MDVEVDVDVDVTLPAFIPQGGTLDVTVGDDSCALDGVPHTSDADPDGDGVPNVCDADDDGDGLDDPDDNCPSVPNNGDVTPLSADDSGYLRDWLLAGPIPDLPSESSCMPSDTEVLGDDAAAAPALGDIAGPTAFFMHSSPGQRVNFLRTMGGPTPREVYGAAYVRSDTERDVTLAIGADDGIRVWLNGEEALRWLTAAAAAGDAGAMSNLGFAYATGTGVPADDATAFDWYQRAADRNLSRAVLVVAAFQEEGRGTPQDLRQAVREYRRALGMGPEVAEVAAARLGLLAAQGRIDDLIAPQEAAPWVAVAAQAGDAEALSWLETQAAAGITQAQGRLGDLYLTLDGGARGAQAVALLRQAAEAGDSFAQFRMGQLYSEGGPVEQDYVQAHVWFNVAATHGLSNAAEMREVISQLMTPEQVAQAQAGARAYFEAGAEQVPGAQDGTASE